MRLFIRVQSRRSMTLPIPILALAALIVAASTGQAQKQWTGAAGADDKWSTGANWLDTTAPVSPYSGTIYFMDADVGNNNVVDHDWDIVTLWYSNAVAGQGHTTDLGGSNLIIRSALYAGGSPDWNGGATANTKATITNGTLQLGTASTPLTLYVGYQYQYGGYYGGGFSPTNDQLIVSGTVNCTNVGTVAVGGRNYLTGAWGDGLLDLSGATLTSRGQPNTFSVGALWIGYGAYYYDGGIGLLKLPSALQSFEVTGNLYMGLGFRAAAPAVYSRGIIDFGAGSSLTNFYVGGNFYLTDEDGVTATLSNLPPNVAMTVGKSNAPARMYVARAQTIYGSTEPTVVNLVLSNGTFTAYLDALIIGEGSRHVNGVGTGLVDIARDVVRVGNEPNKIKGIGTLWIGRGLYGHGTLRLPTNITEIGLGECQIGHGGPYAKALGYLDIGSNSQLKTFSATNGLHFSARDGMGRIGYQSDAGFVDYLPTGVAFTVGSPATNVPFLMATSIGLYDTHTTGTLVLANGAFTGYLSDLIVGSNTAYYGDNVGLLDLSSSSVQIGNEPNKVKVNRLVVAGCGEYSIYGGGGQKSTVLFPSSVTQLIVGDLQVGNGGGTYCTRNNQGLLDFGANSQLQVFSVTNSFYMGSYNAEYGRITGLPTNGLAMSFGQASRRIPVYMGYKTVKNYEGYPPVGEAIIRLTNGTFSAYVTDLLLGVCDNTGSWGDGNGELNLARSTLSAFDVSGMVRVGQGSNTYSGKARGYLNLPAGTATCGTMYIGSPNASFSAGVVELNGTRFAITNNLVIENSGRLTNHVAGVSGGVDFTRADPTGFVITNSGKMHLAFDANPIDTGNWYWGLRLAGDQATFLQGLAGAGKLTWTTNALSPHFVARFGIVYDGKTDKTYVGVAQLTNPGVLFQAL
jgi:hypothetical protein